MHVNQVDPRLEEHERLVDFLDNLAIMLGCIQTLHGQLPDATRPDVIRLNTNKGILFVGDAKKFRIAKFKFHTATFVELFDMVVILFIKRYKS